MSFANLRTALCNVGSLSERAGKTRQYYLKVVFVNHERSQVGTGAALMVGDLRGCHERPKVAADSIGRDLRQLAERRSSSDTVRPAGKLGQSHWQTRPS